MDIELKRIVLEEALLVLMERDEAKNRAEWEGKVKAFLGSLLKKADQTDDETLKKKYQDEYQDKYEKLMTHFDQKQGAEREAPEDTKDKPEKDTPLSIFKKQKDNPALKNDKGTTEMPLQSYMVKNLGLPQQAVQKITKALEKGLKAKGLNIAESVLMEAFLNLDESGHKKKKPKKKKKERSPEEKAARLAQYQNRMAGGSTQEGDLIDSLTKTLNTAKTKEDVLAFKKALKTGKAPQGADELYRQGVFKKKLKDGDSWVKKAQKWFINGKGKDAVKSKMDELPLAKSEEKFDKRELVKGLKAKEYGIIGTIMYNYALKGGAEDMEFIEKFSKLDPKEQQNMLKSVNKILKRQLKRRGWADNEIAQKLNEVFRKQ